MRTGPSWAASSETLPSCGRQCAQRRTCLLSCCFLCFCDNYFQDGVRGTPFYHGGAGLAQPPMPVELQSPSSCTYEQCVRASWWFSVTPSRGYVSFSKLWMVRGHARCRISWAQLMPVQHMDPHLTRVTCNSSIPVGMHSAHSLRLTACSQTSCWGHACASHVVHMHSPPTLAAGIPYQVASGSLPNHQTWQPACAKCYCGGRGILQLRAAFSNTWPGSRCERGPWLPSSCTTVTRHQLCMRMQRHVPRPNE